jgi:hypothetical protein
MENITINFAESNAIPVSFKEVWGTDTKVYYINPQWNTKEFIQYITPFIETDFGISNFELVLSGQNVPIPEMAQSLVISDNINLKYDVFRGQLNFTGFYIRKIDYQYPQMANIV